MDVRNVMVTEVVTVGPNMAVAELAELLMTRQISGAPVVDSGGRLIGVVSLSDVVNALTCQPSSFADFHRSLWLDVYERADLVGEVDRSLTVGELMSSTTYTVTEHESVARAAALMVDLQIHRVVVTDSDEKVVGIISTLDLVKLLPDLLAKVSTAT